MCNLPGYVVVGGVVGVQVVVFVELLAAVVVELLAIGVELLGAVVVVVGFCVVVVVVDGLP
jgi:hypothetical protein